MYTENNQARRPMTRRDYEERARRERSEAFHAGLAFMGGFLSRAFAPGERR